MKLYAVADVPHLVKNLKSMLCNHRSIVLSQDVVDENNLPSDTVSIDHIHALVKFQKDKDLLLAPKLTEALLTPGHFKKMKVGQALQVFSNSVSSALKYLVTNEGYPLAFHTTAWFLRQCDRWFDLMSSRSPIMALSKHKLEKYEEAVNFLRNFSRMISGCKFGEKDIWKPVQSGIAMSTLSIIELSEDLLGTIGFLLTSRLTQDCLENLFGDVRSTNPVPTPLEFKNALKLITVGQYLKHNKTGSYEQDDNDYLADFLSEDIERDEDAAQVEEVFLCDLTSNVVLPNAEVASLYYLAGYCIQSLLKKKQLCKTCVDSILHTGDGLPEATFTLLKEYREGALVRCGVEAFDMLKVVEIVIRQTEPQLKSFNQPLDVIMGICHHNDSIEAVRMMPCHNIKEKLIRKYVSVRLHFLCKKLRAEGRLASSAMSSKSMAMRELVNKL